MESNFLRSILSPKLRNCQSFLDKTAKKLYILYSMRIFRTILASFWAGSMVLLLSIPILSVARIFRFPKIIFFFAKPVIRTGFRIVGVRPIFKGIEGIDFSTPFVLVANHLSNLDGPLLFGFLPADFRVLIKRETRWIPLVGWLMAGAGFIYVDRKKRGIRTDISSKAAQIIRKNRHPFLIFPEGTRSRNGQILPFKKGGVLIAVKAGVPILPVRISGTRDLMPPHCPWIRAGSVEIRFFPPLPTDTYSEGDVPGLVQTIEKIYIEGTKPCIR